MSKEYDAIRAPVIYVAGVPVYPSAFVSDVSRVRRTWKQRLFTWPWRPWRAYRAEETPMAYYVSGEVHVSCKTYSRLQSESFMKESLESMIEKLSRVSGN